VEEPYVRADQAISGTSLAGRDGLTTIVNAAKQRPRPFDVLLIDDTSRLARNLAQALIVIRGLQFCDVRVIAISQGLDSSNPSSQQLFTLYGMMDEQFIQGLADKVRRGQAGRVREGRVAGGRCYGYRNVPIEDPNRRGDYGRPFVVAVDREIIDEEATVVRRIFEMYSYGFSLDTIARTLRAEGVTAPRPPRCNSLRGLVTGRYRFDAPKRDIQRTLHLGPDKKRSG
jgi:DNA invertase Pin-like site-specific DNA recombinase